MAEGTKEDPWELTTAPGTSAYSMWKDEAADPPTLVCQVGSTQLKYQLRASSPRRGCSPATSSPARKCSARSRSR